MAKVIDPLTVTHLANITGFGNKDIFCSMLKNEVVDTEEVIRFVPRFEFMM